MAALRASHKKAGHKVQTSEEKDKEALETCFAWIDGKSAKLNRTTLGDIKRKNNYIYMPHIKTTYQTSEELKQLMRWKLRKIRLVKKTKSKG